MIDDYEVTRAAIKETIAKLLASLLRDSIEVDSIERESEVFEGIFGARDWGISNQADNGNRILTIKFREK